MRLEEQPQTGQPTGADTPALNITALCKSSHRLHMPSLLLRYPFHFVSTQFNQTFSVLLSNSWSACTCITEGIMQYPHQKVIQSALYLKSRLAQLGPNTFAIFTFHDVVFAYKVYWILRSRSCGDSQFYGLEGLIGYPGIACWWLLTLLCYDDIHIGI